MNSKSALLYNLFIQETVVKMIVGMNWVQRPSLIDI